MQPPFVKISLFYDGAVDLQILDLLSKKSV